MPQVPLSGNGLVSGVTLTEQPTAPAAPVAGKRKLFVDPTGGVFLVDAAGTVTPVGGGGAVSSVNGRTGDVVLDAGDVGALDQATADARYVDAAGDGMSGALTVTGKAVTASPDAGNQVVWNANGFYVPAPPAAGMANPMTGVGDVIVGAASGAPARLGVGTTNQVLTVVGGTPSWQTPASGGMANPMTSPEDLIKGGSAGLPTRVAVGTNGQVLTVTSGALGWATPTAYLTQATADTLYANVAGDTMTGDLALPNLTATGDVSPAGRLTITGTTTGAAASVYRTAIDGLVVRGAAGSSNALYFLNAAGQVAFYTPAGTQNLYVGGFSTWQLNTTPLAGGIGKSAADGLVVRGVTGTTGDLALQNNAGSAVLSVPAGTADLVAAGKLGVGGLNVAAAPSQVVNGGFEVNQRGGTVTANNAYAHDRWQILLGGTSTISVTDETAVVDAGSGHALKAVYVHNAASRVDQKIENYLQLRGRTVTFQVRVRQGAAASARAYVEDSGSRTYSATQATTGAYLTFAVSLAIGAAATAVRVGVELGASDTVYLDNAVLTVGSAAADYVPLDPATELARCLRYYQTWGGEHASQFLAVGQCWATTRAQVYLPFQVPLGGAPTVVVSSASHWGVYDAGAVLKAATAVTANNVTARGVYLDAAVASGLVAGNGTIMAANGTLSARVSAEWNP